MISKVSGLLLELNETERFVMAEILRLAEQHIDGMERLRWSSGRCMDKATSASLAKGFIQDLRKDLGIEPPPNERDAHPRLA